MNPGTTVLLDSLYIGLVNIPEIVLINVFARIKYGLTLSISLINNTEIYTVMHLIYSLDKKIL